MARFEAASPEITECIPDGASTDALFELGLMYCTGRDADPDLITAHKWFNIAAMRGNDAAKQYRQEISREMSKAEIATAQKLAREWLTRH